MDRIEREMAALGAEHVRVQHQLDKLADDEARKVARAVAEGRTENEIKNIRDSFGPGFNKLWKVQRRLDARLYEIEKLGYQLR